MSNINGALSPLVDDLDAALTLYQCLADGQEPARFRFRDVELARVEPFLLLSGKHRGLQGSGGDTTGTGPDASDHWYRTGWRSDPRRTFTGPQQAATHRPPPERLGLRVHRKRMPSHDFLNPPHSPHSLRRGRRVAGGAR